MDEDTTIITASGIPIKLKKEIEQLSTNFSKAVRVLLEIGLEEYKKRQSADRKGA